MERADTLSHPEHTRLWTAGSSSQTSPSRCTPCSPQRKERARNLIVCIDGTCNESTPNRTNVRKLFEMIEKESTNLQQYALYISGIGTDEKSYLTPGGIKEQRPFDFNGTNSGEKSSRLFDGTVVSKLLDVMFALHATKSVKEAYHWLAMQYQEGDQIYLFGFSRGAYQVRVLAGMVHEVGLLRETATKDQIESAYNCYEASHQGKLTARRAAKDFRNVFCSRDVKVHFIGVWDTVSSIGLERKDVFLSVFPSVGHACRFRHALALDERRVKFMPEYFCEINSRTSCGESVHTGTSRDVDQARFESDSSADLLKRKENLDVKEVWFAGSHSDVGGMSIPGEFRNAGHVSLLWMRREAVASGLVLKPTDLVWLPEDIDVGITDPVTPFWRALEYLPFKHQVSFSGTGKHASIGHRLQPRRIIPGQKVHASVLYANTYKPRATLGTGFDIPIPHTQSDENDVELNTGFWETGLFDDTAAQELVTSLCSRKSVAPIYLDRLLFMLRFGEGMRCVREVTDWKDKLMKVIRGRDHPTLVRLVAIVVYHAASCDLGGCLEGCAELPQAVFPGAKECMHAILDAHRNGNDRTVVALLRLLTRHQILRQRILLPDVVQKLVDLLDTIIRKPTDNFTQAMSALVSLLQCSATRQSTIEKLGVSPPKSVKSRLSSILEVQDTNSLTAALRMMLVLARTAEASTMCAALKPKLRSLASKQEGPVGHLAAEILLVLHDPDDHDQLDIHDARVRANLAGALVHLNIEGHYTAGNSGDPGQQILCHLFGHHTTQLSDSQNKLIEELKKAVDDGDDRERIVATITLLRLCETPIIRTKLREIGLLDTFISQLQQKNKALLAAYAFVSCPEYSDLKESIIKNDKDWPKYIINMLERDYFDDAVGPVEGFRIFENFMQDAELRERIVRCDIINVLWTKLGNGGRENQTGLICLDIILTCDLGLSWTDKLVETGLEHLRSAKTRETEAMILSALAQTAHTMVVICRIIEILLPGPYRQIQETLTPEATGSSTAAERETEPTDTLSITPRGTLLGHVRTLHILTQNETLRGRMRQTEQYRELKKLHDDSGTFVGRTSMLSWPNRGDAVKALGELFKAVDQ